MKVKKFSNLKTFEDLFMKLWKFELSIDDFELSTHPQTNDVNLNCKCTTPINLESYKSYKKFFEILIKLDLDFELDRGFFNVLMFQVEIDKFITEMEILINAKKFNL